MEWNIGDRRVVEVLTTDRRPIRDKDGAVKILDSRYCDIDAELKRLV